MFLLIHEYLLLSFLSLDFCDSYFVINYFESFSTVALTSFSGQPLFTFYIGFTFYIFYATFCYCSLQISLIFQNVLQLITHKSGNYRSVRYLLKKISRGIAIAIVSE